MDVGALESTLVSTNSRTGEVESQLASRNSELTVAADNLSSNERCLRFAEDAVEVMRKQVQGHGPQLHGLEYARATAESARVAAECTIHSLALSDLAVPGNSDRLRQHLNEQREEIVIVRQDSDCKVEEVFFARVGLQGRLVVTASQLLNARNSLMLALE